MGGEEAGEKIERRSRGKEKRRKEGREGRGIEGKNNSLKFDFWNVAKIKRKNEEFWETIKEWDLIGLVETWLKLKNWKKWRSGKQKFRKDSSGERRIDRETAAGGMLIKELRKD